MKQFLIAIMALFFIAPAHADVTLKEVTRKDVLEAQQEWADSIVKIGKVFQDKGDYKATAAEVIEELYAYDESAVLFKPTLASEDQFRETFDQALSYFVGGIVEEDKGFAIKPWSNVRFGEQQIITYPTAAKSSGKYYFTPADGGEEVEVEFTFGYMKNEDGDLVINLHHSSMPYSQ